jgi:hypothetical protein
MYGSDEAVAVSFKAATKTLALTSLNVHREFAFLTSVEKAVVKGTLSHEVIALKR